MNELKRILVALLALTAPIGAVASRPAPGAPAPVVRAVVYPDRALVTRALDVGCGRTPVSALFEGLPLGLDETTLRAAVLGGGGRVEGLSLRERVLEEPHLAQLRELDAQLEALQAKIRETQGQQALAASERAQAESLRAAVPAYVTREAAADPKPRTQAWAAALDSSRKLIEQADGRARAADAKLRELGRELQELQRRRGAISSGGPARAMEAEVLVRCEAESRARVELSYMAGGLSWKPVYEARAAQGRGRLELSVHAEVVQASGEEWKDVEVILSTATTRRDATPPEPKRLHVGATEQGDKKKVLVRRYEQVSHLSNLAEEPATGAVQAAEQGLSVQLKVPGRIDFPGDGRPLRLFVERHDLQASWALVTVPKMAPFAFRRVQAINRAPYPLLAGRVELFSEDSYLGHAQLEQTARGDRIELAFGIEEPVKVKRVVLEELSRDPGFLGSTRRLLYGYRIELASHEARPVEIELQEHVPVSQLDDVKVLVDEKATTKGFERAKDDGILTWKVKLAPGEKKQVELRFAVEIPEAYDSSAL